MQRRTPSQQNKDAAANKALQLKKPTDLKRNSLEENADGSSVSSNLTKEEDDIYEFKSTPKDTNSSDDKSDSGKNSDKSSDEKSGTDESSSNQPKRTYSDVEGNEDNTSVADDENKRKKRKETDNQKELNKSATVRVPLRQEKGTKLQSGPASKTNIVGKNIIDRKSPSASPKPVAKTADSDAETDDSLKSDNLSSTGPKVPPLKIVIPQQNHPAGDQEVGSRNGKSASARSHTALPYVVASSNSTENPTEKETSLSRCSSPTTTDSTKIMEDKNSKTNLTGTPEERAQQRVLRSSNRSSGQSVDRGSNNSSPQLQSSSPSPAPSCSTETTNQQSILATNNGSPGNSQQQSLSETDTTANVPSPSSSSSSCTTATQNTVELHPRKRKIRASKEENKSGATNIISATDEKDGLSTNLEVHPHDQPITNCYQMYINIRKQIERRQRVLYNIIPKPPQGFKDYLMNRCTYVLAGKNPSEPLKTFPSNLTTPAMRDMFTLQEKERHKLKMQHVVEKEKLVLAVEQEILRVHGRAARALANQSLPFSVCTILKDEEVYNMITPEQEEKDRNARSRYNGRLFLSWLQDVDDKWEKIKEAMLLRHHNEAESLHAVQKMDWEWKMKELLLCEFKAKPVIEEPHVPMVHVSDDFDLLPA